MMKAVRQAVIVLTLALLVIPKTSTAQIDMEVTQAEVKNVGALGDVLRADLLANKSLINDPAFQARDAAAKAACDAIGTSLNLITGSTETTLWSGAPDFYCSGARYGWGGRYADSGVHVRLVGIGQGNPAVFNVQVYTEQQNQAAASTGVEPAIWERILNAIFVGAGNILASLLAGLATLSLYLLDYMIGATPASSPPAVINSVWLMIRDFVNLLFILALIAMALGTILRRDDYNYKTMLRNLIVMAILINFSQAIAIALINVSDMLINTLQPMAGVKEIGVTLFKAFTTAGGGETAFFGQNINFVQGIGSTVTKLIALTVITISVAAIAILMFIRLIGLWILVALSPAAYALNVMPATKNLAQRWWSTFTKYLIWGPVAMFFFRVGFVLIGSQSQGGVFSNDLWLNNIFIAGFFMAGLMVARSAGMMGASAIVSGADKAFAKAKKIGNFGTSAAGNYVWRGNAARHLTHLATGGNAELAKKAGEKFGAATAWIENEPKRQTYKWVEKPNKDRKRVVEEQYRKSMMKRNYWSDFDEDTGKKLNAKDVTNMVQFRTYNETKLRNILEHGNAGTKTALVAAFKEGLIKPMKDLEQNQVDELSNETLKFAWQQKGGKKGEMPKEFGYDDITYKPKKPKVTLVAVQSGKDLQTNLDNFYVKTDEKRKFKNNGELNIRRTDSSSTLTITDSDAPVREQSSEQRLQGRKEAAGMGKPDTTNKST
ncbi:MAG: type IV secretion system protein [Candidatus Doudnabacteria bacterium]|nr:type IV secretion system protein [Candidatus Doudnabacteria bacterium]